MDIELEYVMVHLLFQTWKVTAKRSCLYLGCRLVTTPSYIHERAYTSTLAHVLGIGHRSSQSKQNVLAVYEIFQKVFNHMISFCAQHKSYAGLCQRNVLFWYIFGNLRRICKVSGGNDGILGPLTTPQNAIPKVLVHSHCEILTLQVSIYHQRYIFIQPPSHAQLRG